MSVAKKARKWSNIAEAVPEEEKPLSEREIAVRKLMDELRVVKAEDQDDRPATMKDFAQEYGSLAEEDDFAGKEAKRRSIRFEALERLIMPELRRIEEMSGQDKWRGEGQTFSPRTTIIPQIADRDAFHKYLKETNQEELFTVKDSKVRELVEDAIKAVEEMSPEERAESKFNLLEPLPGVKLFIKKSVHRTET